MSGQGSLFQSMGLSPTPSSPHPWRIMAQVEIRSAVLAEMARQQVDEEELARRMNRSQAFLHRFLDGSIGIPGYLLGDIAEVLGCSVKVALARR